jgi:asparaginyl-tRNA synthetase
MHVYAGDLRTQVGNSVTVKGWVYNRTDKGKLRFLLIRDGTGTVQAVVFAGNVSEEVFAAADSVTQESSVEVTGGVREDARAPGGFELDVTHLDIVHQAEPYPITPKEHGTSFLMEHRHLWIRSTRQHAVLRIRSEIIKAARDYLDNNGFTLVDTPILTPAACEGTTTLFELDYFGQLAYLSQSGQLYNEATCASLGKTYCFGPTFRAEKSKTRRHLMEFWMVEPEVAFANLDDLMVLTEEYLSYIVQQVLEKRGPELETLERNTEILSRVRPPFPRISYAEAFDILEREGTETLRGSDFGGGDETVVSDEFEKPLIVHRFPAEIKAFYMQPDPTDPSLALCMDMLAPEGYGEILGGSQRVHDVELLEKRIREHGLPEDAFRWYLDLRRYGSVPHSGFGMGIERVVAWICGLKHIRETIPFPRMLHRIYP